MIDFYGGILITYYYNRNISINIFISCLCSSEVNKTESFEGEHVFRVC